MKNANGRYDQKKCYISKIMLFDFYSRAKSPVELSKINSLAEFPIPKNIEGMITKKPGGETDDGPIAPPRRFKKEVLEKCVRK